MRKSRSIRHDSRRSASGGREGEGVEPRAELLWEWPAGQTLRSIRNVAALADLCARRSSRAQGGGRDRGPRRRDHRRLVRSPPLVRDLLRKFCFRVIASIFEPSVRVLLPKIEGGAHRAGRAERCSGRAVGVSAWARTATALSGSDHAGAGAVHDRFGHGAAMPSSGTRHGHGWRRGAAAGSAVEQSPSCLFTKDVRVFPLDAVDVAGRRRSPSSTADVRPGTRACTIAPTRRGSKRSSP